MKTLVDPVNGQIHTINPVPPEEKPDDELGAHYRTTCGKHAEEFDSPELGAALIHIVAEAPVFNPRFCPDCRKVYDAERTKLEAWNEQVTQK